MDIHDDGKESLHSMDESGNDRNGCEMEIKWMVSHGRGVQYHTANTKGQVMMMDSTYQILVHNLPKEMLFRHDSFELPNL